MKNDLFSLKGRVALVTGATGYLGQSIVFGLAQQGAHVLAHGRNQEKLNQLVQNGVEQGFSIQSVVFDISDPLQIEQFFLNYPLNTLDILVNNAYSGVAGTVETAVTEEYEQSYSTSVIASHNMLKYGLKFLRDGVRKNNDASVINIASMYGMVSPDLSIYDSAKSSNPPFYGAAKAALIQFTKYAACEFAKDKIRVNAISPGPFPSPVTQKNMPEFIEKLNMKVPMGRIGSAEELKSAVCFLASASSSYITGINLPVDGGWTSW